MLRWKRKAPKEGFNDGEVRVNYVHCDKNENHHGILINVRENNSRREELVNTSMHRITAIQITK